MNLVEVEGKRRDRLDIEIFNFDPTLAPSGKTVVKVNFDSEYDYWNTLNADPAEYKKMKQHVADVVAEALSKRFEGFKQKVEVSDVVTPVSVQHWTCGYRGFAQPWPAPAELAKQISKSGVSKTLPGLGNFYMVGQWAGGTFGISTVCMMGKNLVKELCKKDQKQFKATTVR